jgi:8-oxo-dGTP diphosphatase
MNDTLATMRRPVAATIVGVIHGGRVLLVRRKIPPDAGCWGFPGGKIEFGETIEAAAERELFWETAIRGKASHVFTTVDAFEPFSPASTFLASQLA